MRREVLALREALEQARFAHDTGIARLQAAHNLETAELQSLARSLREALESQRNIQEQTLEAQRLHLGSEIRALQHSLQASRVEFDATLARLESRHLSESQAAALLRAELEATVRHLRTLLDERG